MAGAHPRLAIVTGGDGGLSLMAAHRHDMADPGWRQV